MCQIEKCGTSCVRRRVVSGHHKKASLAGQLIDVESLLPCFVTNSEEETEPVAILRDCLFAGLSGFFEIDAVDYGCFDECPVFSDVGGRENFEKPI